MEEKLETKPSIMDKIDKYSNIINATLVIFAVGMLMLFAFQQGQANVFYFQNGVVEKCLGVIG